jgi:hypothetical protein
MPTPIAGFDHPIIAVRDMQAARRVAAHRARRGGAAGMIRSPINHAGCGLALICAKGSAKQR